MRDRAGVLARGLLVAVGLCLLVGTAHAQDDKAIRIRDGSVDAVLSGPTRLEPKVGQTQKWSEKARRVRILSGPSAAEACGAKARSVMETIPFESVSFTVVNRKTEQRYDFTAENRGFLFKKLNLDLDGLIRFVQDATNAQLWRLQSTDGAADELRLAQITVKTRPARDSSVIVATEGEYLCAEFSHASSPRQPIP